MDTGSVTLLVLSGVIQLFPLSIIDFSRMGFRFRCCDIVEFFKTLFSQLLLL